MYPRTVRNMHLKHKRYVQKQVHLVSPLRQNTCDFWGTMNANTLYVTSLRVQPILSDQEIVSPFVLLPRNSPTLIQSGKEIMFRVLDILTLLSCPLQTLFLFAQPGCLILAAVCARCQSFQDSTMSSPLTEN